MESFDQPEETFKKLKRYFNSREYRRQMRKLYSNRRVMKKQIRKMEAIVAQSIADLGLRGTPADSLDVSQLERDMEWFLTWRLKLGRFPYRMWCDGVEILLMRKLDKRSYHIEARAWVGPEADTRVESLCPMKGIMTLNARSDELRSYELQIAYQGQTYCTRKAI